MRHPPVGEAVLAPVTAVLSTLVLLTGCAAGSGDDGRATRSSPAGSGSISTPTAGAVTVPISIHADDVTPSGSLVRADVGQPIDLVVTSDAATEIHVHSNPEHEFEVPAGAQRVVFEFTVDQPGEIDVESHTLDVLIVKLQVS
jgi:hypothetical protein